MSYNSVASVNVHDEPTVALRMRLALLLISKSKDKRILRVLLAIFWRGCAISTLAVTCVAHVQEQQPIVIAVFAPATVSNVGCGFDVLGFVIAAPIDRSGVEIASIDGDDGRLPRDVSRNTASTAAQALLARLGTVQGVSLRIQKGM